MFFLQIWTLQATLTRNIINFSCSFFTDVNLFVIREYNESFNVDGKYNARMFPLLLQYQSYTLSVINYFLDLFTGNLNVILDVTFDPFQRLVLIIFSLKKLVALPSKYSIFVILSKEFDMMKFLVTMWK